MRHLLFAVLVLFSATSLAQSVAKAIEKDDVVMMESDVPAMKTAMEVARASLDDFLEIANHPAAHQSDFALKVAIKQGKDTEYFWLTDFKSKGGGRFEGEIGNEPQLVKNVKMGQSYLFTRAQIVDWLYIDDAQGRMVGNFTMCALLTQESKEDAAEMIDRYKLDCSKVYEAK